jgi:hypothetical protein
MCVWVDLPANAVFRIPVNMCCTDIQGVHKVLVQLLTLITLDVHMIETHCKRYIKA